MAKYIDAEAVKSAVRDAVNNGFASTLYDQEEIIDALPAADVEPVRHGRWIKYAGKLVCSECNRYPPMKDESGGWRTHHEWPYCPNCGAKMDGGETNGLGKRSPDWRKCRKRRSKPYSLSSVLWMR